jgi:hypothetical protein
MSACNHSKQKNEHLSAGAKNKIAVMKGKKFAEKACSTCHLPVPPAYLDKKTWINNVLPVMAHKMGIGVYGKKRYYPKKGSLIPLPQWFKIVTYYKNKAPDKLNVPKDKIALLDSSPAQFSIKKPQWNDKLHNIAATTLVSYDSLNHQIYTSSAIYKKIYRWDRKLKPSFLSKSFIGAVNAFFYQDSTGDNHGVFTAIGSMKQINKKTGKVVNINLRTHAKRIIADSLPRPVFVLPGDFNKDGLKDWIVGAFGHTIGGLYLYQQKNDGKFKKKAIRNVPGAIDAVVRDFNHDGWPDVMVLFAQAKESIRLFMNDQKGGFKQKVLLRFPPVYGSDGFQLADFNHDEKPDILYAAGDNADYSPVLKPYHGVYIFINQGHYHYKQAYFYHINGATKAMAADFDNDGDLDIAVISFFADLKGKSHSSFVYLKQVGPMHFEPSAPANLDKMGRWISMDVADIDRDGNPDILLGNYSRGFTGGKIKTSWNKKVPFVVLENKTRN